MSRGGFNDLTGNRFGRLEVISIMGQATNGTYLWLCKCDCGNYVNVRTNNLNNGSTQSCGCFKKDFLISKNHIENRYEFFENYGIGYTTKEEKFYFDVEDYEKIKTYCWSSSKNSLRAGKNHKRISLSRLIMNLEDDNPLVVDHIDGNWLDNRKKNLRICTSPQNTLNTKLIWKNNTSGHKGVYLDKRYNRWLARIQYNKKTISLGMYDTFEEAKNARIKAELKLFGEFSRENNHADPQ
jgi:hypothetical protein